MSRVPWNDGVEVAPEQRLRHKEDGVMATILWLYDSPTAYVQFDDRRYGSYPFDELVEAFERSALEERP